MVKILKKKFRIKKKFSGEDKLKHSASISLVLPKIKIKPKLGRWCQYYEGRLPYPIECSANKACPVSSIFKGGKKNIIKNFPACVYCERAPSFLSWKNGDWNKIIEAIKKGEDLTDMDPPMER